jgi:hypothetical protein
MILTPNVDSIPIFYGIGYPEYIKNEFIRYRCRESQLSVYQQELQDFCRKLTFSISSIIHQQALGKSSHFVCFNFFDVRGLGL